MVMVVTPVGTTVDVEVVFSDGVVVGDDAFVVSVVVTADVGAPVSVEVDGSSEPPPQAPTMSTSAAVRSMGRCR
jgi:hypothetical protein